MKKEIPILFSTPMVQAILEGRKTQTRRIVKYPKILDDALDLDMGSVQSQLTLDRMQSGYKEGVRPVFEIDEDADTAFSVRCPYGQPGDLLWVRETFNYVRDSDTKELVRYGYKATDNFKDAVWRPSIHMPKAAARIWLEVVNVRVERLQAITPDDALAEGVGKEICDHCPLEKKGVYSVPGGFTAGCEGARCEDASDNTVEAFEALWTKINGPESWEQNPWVWVVEFKKVERP